MEWPQSFWFIGWIIFVIVFCIVSRLWWWQGPRRGWHNYDKDALSYLKERYAKGEINKEEFERIKKDLLS